MEYQHGKGLDNPVVAMIAAAILFGAALPVLKLLLAFIEPLPLIALISAGMAGGILAWQGFRAWGGEVEPSMAIKALPSRDRFFLAGTVLAGGVAAPAIQLHALSVTPAAAGSLLMNFEIVSTILIAALVFREKIDRVTGLALALIVAASILLSWNGEGSIPFSAGSVGILFSCVLWGLDNNLMGRIEGLQPGWIVFIKAAGGGAIAGSLALLLGELFPGWLPAILAVATGFFAFSGGLVLFTRALRSMGAARAGAIYAAAPFIGCIVSLLVFAVPPGPGFLVALPVFLLGAVIIMKAQWAGQPGA